MLMKKMKNSKEITVVDATTGEIKEVTTEVSYFEKIKSEEHFFMIFIESMAPFFNLKSDTCKTILMKFCTMAEWNTGIVTLSAAKRKELCQELNCTNQTFSNCLTLLKKNKLIDGKDGEFKINPQIFWKGDTSSRKELLKDKAIQISFGICDIL